MNSPKLDGRTVSDILALFSEKSKAYTPEWKFDENNPDGGTALAMLFSEMFCGTVDRLDRFPEKCSLEFLNLIGVSGKPVSPAVGIAAAELADGANRRVFVEKGSQLFSDVDSKRIIFETMQSYFAVPSKLTDIYMTDSSDDVITHTELNEDFALKLFFPDKKQNIEKHSFTICDEAVLKLDGAAEITLIPGGAYGVKDEDVIEMLCRSDTAKWTMPTENGIVSLIPRSGNGCIILSKPDGKAQLVNDDGEADNNGKYSITCEITRTDSAFPLSVDEIRLSSKSVDDEQTLRGRLPDKLYFNDTELFSDESAYAFGKEPNIYDVFYIKSDEVFSKAGALITADFSVTAVVVSDGEEQLEPDFEQKLLVDKSELKTKEADEIYITEVIWEYWNGLGWARLAVGGDVDLFSCHDKIGRHTLTFVCPDDIKASVQNSAYGIWIRARIREMKNRFSLNGRWYLPLIKAIDLRFDYGKDMMPAKSIITLNSCRRRKYEMNGTKTRMDLFSVMPDTRRCVYFRFDEPPCGLPVNLYLGFDSECANERKYEFSYSSSSQLSLWRELKVVDRTCGFCGSGIISMYTPDDFAKAELFGMEGYWVRVLEPFGADRKCSPNLIRVDMNAVDIIQQTTVKDERAFAAMGKKNQTLNLGNFPVINCTVWVNEMGETQVSELEELGRIDKSKVRVENASNGLPNKYWVRWEQTESLAACGENSRCYELDSASGVITFGNGTNGKIPAYSSNAEISVDYSWGGGTVGNLKECALDGLLVGIPFVENMTNILPTCGGSDAQPLEKVKKIGAQRVRHCGRAVTVRDYEAIVAEEFPEVGEVKCFSGKNNLGQQESGCLTVVVKPANNGTDAYAVSLCKRIEAYLKECGCSEPIYGGRMSVIPARNLKVSADIVIVIKNIEYAAQTETEVIAAVNDLIDRFSNGIGIIPLENDIYSALKEVPNIAYTTRTLLTGEYIANGVAMAIPLDRMPDYPYFIPTNGTHTVRIDGASGL